MPTIKIVNATTGEEIERQMNAKELAQLAADKEIDKIAKEKAEKTIIAKSALLEKLGITEEEAKLLLS